jgi:hypothetical protein
MSDAEDCCLLESIEDNADESEFNSNNEHQQQQV